MLLYGYYIADLFPYCLIILVFPIFVAMNNSMMTILFYKFIEVELIYNAVLISAVEQSDSVIHIYTHIDSFSYSFPS